MILAILLTIPLIVALFTKKDYLVERQITINRPKQEVFNYIKLLKNQVHYSKWAMMDTNARMQYKGTDGTVGFVSVWESDNKKVGKGEQEITAITEGSRVDISLHFIKPFEGKGNAYLVTEAASPTQTTVKWGMYGRMNYPMNFMLVVMNMDKMLGGELAEGLTNLKSVLEKQ
jgi:hypothetical protein